jgi:NifU-like protein involved in Fe-S cluster formation
VRYSEETLHYFRTAPAAGVLSGSNTGRGAAGARERGTWVQFDLRVEEGVIRDARFLAFGCPHTIAVSAYLARLAVDRTASGTLPETVQDLSERFAVPVEKRGRLLVIEDAWLEALNSAVQRKAPASHGSPTAGVGIR